VPGVNERNPARRRGVLAARLGVLVVAAALALVTDSPYADVRPGPTPDLTALVTQANDPADLDPSFTTTSGRWLATTIDARQLTWGGWAWCKATGCDVYPVATGPRAHESAAAAMARSVREAADAAAQVTGPPTYPARTTADLGEVGGSSAGLMLTLAFIDATTPGDLTGGRVIAGTGTMNSLLEAGPVNGVEHKVAGAVQAGAQVFFTPKLRAEQASAAAAGTGVTVVPVAYLTDALAYLCQTGGRSSVCETVPTGD